MYKDWAASVQGGKRRTDEEYLAAFFIHKCKADTVSSAINSRKRWMQRLILAFYIRQHRYRTRNAVLALFTGFERSPGFIGYHVGCRGAGCWVRRGHFLTCTSVWFLVFAVFLMVGVAQLAEHQVVALGVVGSSPITHPIRKARPLRRQRRNGLIICARSSAG